MSYLDALHPHQMERARDDQVRNPAGGYVWRVSDHELVRRFLILGATSTMYTSRRKIARDAIEAIARIMQTEEGALGVLDMARDISVRGLAVKNEPAILVVVLGLTHQSERVRKRAEQVFNDVVRTGYHLFQAAHYINHLRGWGRSIRRTFRNWYLSKTPDELAYQLIKYQGRIVDEGDKGSRWTHRDVLRKAHATPTSAQYNALFRYATRGEVLEGAPQLVFVRELIKRAQDVEEVLALIREYNLTHEFVPSEWLGHGAVWKALLPNLPITATLRNLGRMSALGILEPGSEAERLVIEKITDEERIIRGRVNPLAVHAALKTYLRGRGFRGNLRWEYNKRIANALQKALGTSFRAVEGTGKRILVALDVSGSMMYENLPIPNTSAAEGGAVIAAALMRAEPNAYLIGVDTEIHEIGEKVGATPTYKQLADIVDEIGGGGTDLSLPFDYLLRKKINVDAVVILTDSVTWAGGRHPFELLQEYRRCINKDTLVFLVAMTAEGYTIIEPEDKRSINLVGYDASLLGAIQGMLTD